MINSMTGYGEAQGEIHGVTYVVEVKTLNNRYFKANIKLPETVGFLEEDIDKLLRQSISRGTINYVLRQKNVSANGLFSIDEKVLGGYMKNLSRIAASAGIECRIDIGSIFSLPGISAMMSPDEKTAGEIRDKILSISGEAIEKLKQMRLAEGAAVVADLDGYCRVMKEGLEKIRDRSTVVPEEYQRKLKKRIDRLLAEAKLKLDEETLAREVAVFAERSDISEEISRLDSHLEQFSESCRANAMAGRKLDFISQEMLREANTIASKASDSEIARLVVDIKCQIDRIKEQVQNIE